VKFVSLPIGEIGVCTQKASPKKISIQVITLIALSRLIAMKGNYRIRKNMDETLVEETARACRFP
jgi:hypothetical protein